MIFWLYLADRVDLLSESISSFFVMLFTLSLILVGLGGLFYIHSESEDIDCFSKYKDFIINSIKRYKLVPVCAVLAIIYVLLPSKSFLYTKVALDVGSIVVDKLTPIQQKAFKSIELFLDDYIKDQEKSTEQNAPKKE